ncbi:hypothetical protein BJ912DRAFT_935215 [Pholiota molesta]|nr:hypothetical protein BJ912DRAFT_935215 [Pholiota molesta]
MLELMIWAAFDESISAAVKFRNIRRQRYNRDAHLSGLLSLRSYCRFFVNVVLVSVTSLLGAIENLNVQKSKISWDSVVSLDVDCMAYEFRELRDNRNVGNSLYICVEGMFASLLLEESNSDSSRQAHDGKSITDVSSMQGKPQAAGRCCTLSGESELPLHGSCGYQQKISNVRNGQCSLMYTPNNGKTIGPRVQGQGVEVSLINSTFT